MGPESSDATAHKTSENSRGVEAKTASMLLDDSSTAPAGGAGKESDIPLEFDDAFSKTSPGEQTKQRLADNAFAPEFNQVGSGRTEKEANDTPVSGNPTSAVTRKLAHDAFSPEFNTLGGKDGKDGEDRLDGLSPVDIFSKEYDSQTGDSAIRDRLEGPAAGTSKGLRELLFSNPFAPSFNEIGQERPDADTADPAGSGDFSVPEPDSAAEAPERKATEAREQKQADGDSIRINPFSTGPRTFVGYDRPFFIEDEIDSELDHRARL